jgi:hypothetical protein
VLSRLTNELLRSMSQVFEANTARRRNSGPGGKANPPREDFLRDFSGYAPVPGAFNELKPFGL